LKSIFELSENLSIVLTKLDTELGLAQPQLVLYYMVQLVNDFITLKILCSLLEDLIKLIKGTQW